MRREKTSEKIDVSSFWLGKKKGLYFKYKTKYLKLNEEQAVRTCFVPKKQKA